MVISRTPFRISFFGGGTDFPQWYKNHEGMVISTTIDKYCFISIKEIPPFVGYKYRIVYSKQELTNDIKDIEHPSARACLGFMQMHNKRIEVIHSGDLPSKAGLGSSSAFTVGLINALNSMTEEKFFNKESLADAALYVEHKLLNEAVGSQDQIATAIGGFNVIRFIGEGRNIRPLLYDNRLNDYLMLFFTGTTRFASEIEKTKIDTISQKESYYQALLDIAKQAQPLFIKDIGKIGKLLHESWMLKKQLSDKVSNKQIDDIYEVAMNNGATGGKLLGSGGGGFLLFFVEPSKHDRVRSALRHLMEVNFHFETKGSTIIYNENER
jgi:D-glycero-alpha-D-manno-heptose-7-phosphate kinase